MDGETYYGECLDCGDRWTEDEPAVVCPECGSTSVTSSDEPPGAGDDPFGRPDPRTHPEYWTE